MAVEPKPDRVYRTERIARVVGSAVFWFLALGPFTGLVAALVMLPNRQPAASAGEVIAVVALLGGLGTFFLISALSVNACGRLVLKSDRAELSRIPVPPACLRKPREVVYAKVVRWGIGTATVDLFAHVTQMVFEVIDDNGGAKKMHQALSHFPQAAEIVDEFKKRIGKDPLMMKQPMFGGLQFEDSPP